MADSKKCKRCNIDFTSSGKAHCKTYCSNKCRSAEKYDRLYRKASQLLNCKVCGSDFIKKHNSQRFCSYKCAYTNKHEEIKSKRQLNKLPKPERILKCNVCKAEFKPSYKHQRTCSDDCQNQFIGQKGKRILRSCNVCGKEFKPYTSTNVFCSYHCGIENKKNQRSVRKDKLVEIRKGNLNPAFVHGKRAGGGKHSGVGQKFFDRVKNKMRDEMKEEYGYYFCERCGISSTTQRFEMHHLIYRTEKPNHPLLHSPKNLINLCVKCHNWFHLDKSNRDEIVEARGLKELFKN